MWLRKRDLQYIKVALRLNLERGKDIMAMLDDLTAQVAANTSVVQSAIVLIKGLHDKLVEAGTDPVKLAALKDELAASDAALAAAVAENTP